MMGISLFICTAVAVSTISLLILETLSRRRLQRHTFDDSLERLRRIIQAAQELPALQGEEPAARRMAILREILLDTKFIHYLVSRPYFDDPAKDPEVRERIRAVVSEITRLNWEIYKSLFLFRFCPQLVADWQRIVDARKRHCRVWIAYLQLLKAKYPQRYGHISLPDPP